MHIGRFSSHILSIHLIHFFLILTRAKWTDSQENEAFYIEYEGNVSATYTLLSNPNCTYDLGPQNTSFLYIGAHATWDSNPFFFELYHDTSVSCGLFGGKCTNLRKRDEKQQVVYTTDEIFNLDFVTAGRVCYKDGQACGSTAVNPYYVADEVINLHEANVTRMQYADGLGYSVLLDKGAWSGNGTITPHVDLQQTPTTDPTDCEMELKYDDHVVVQW